MNKVKWIRPSGREIITNDLDATIAYAVKVGWELAGEEGAQNALLKLDKEELETYAKNKYGVDLDRRKSEGNLRKEVAELGG